MRTALHPIRALAFSSLLLGHSLAIAAEPAPPAATKILVIAAGDDPTATRVVAELRASGLPVTTVYDAVSPHTAIEVQRLSESADAVATVEMDSRAAEVRIWTVNRSSGEITLRSIVRLDEDSAIVALRATEGLRASLNDPGWFAPPRIVALAATPNDHGASPAAVAHPRFGAALGLALASGGGQFGGSWEGLLSVHWLWAPRWGIEAMGVLPLTSAQRVESDGSATLAFGLVAGGVRMRLLSVSWCVLDVSAGGGAAMTHTRGFPNAGFFATDRTTWVATPYTRIGYAVSIVPPFSLRADVAAALAIPRPTFTFAGDTTSWGELLLLASAGLELVFL